MYQKLWLLSMFIFHHYRIIFPKSILSLKSSVAILYGPILVLQKDFIELGVAYVMIWKKRKKACLIGPFGHNPSLLCQLDNYSKKEEARNNLFISHMTLEVSLGCKIWSDVKLQSLLFNTSTLIQVN